MKLAIVGSRNFNNLELFVNILDKYCDEHDVTEIVTGDARGADAFAIAYAEANNIPYKSFKAQWHKHGKGAGFIRNQEIWANADQGIAFWDGESPGTKHSIELSSKQQKHLTLITKL